MPDEAQWEIQKLTESRDKASSNEYVKREWEVVSFKERPRRKISLEKGKWQGGMGKKGLVEWVIVFRVRRWITRREYCLVSMRIRGIRSQNSRLCQRAL
jgi:hypothetical protein